MRTIDIGSALLSLARTMRANGSPVLNRIPALPPFDDYFCLGFAGCESGNVYAAAGSHLNVVFFEFCGRSVGIYSDDLTLEIGFEGLCRYGVTPPQVMAATAIRNRIFFIVI